MALSKSAQEEILPLLGKWWEKLVPAHNEFQKAGKREEEQFLRCCGALWLINTLTFEITDDHTKGGELRGAAMINPAWDGKFQKFEMKVGG